MAEPIRVPPDSGGSLDDEINMMLELDGQTVRQTKRLIKPLIETENEKLGL